MTKEELQTRLFDLEKQVTLLKKRISILEQRSTPFKKPTPEEVGQYFYIKESDHNEAIKFYNFYESKDWKVGKAKMKNWKAAARNWISKQPKKEISIFDL